MINLSPTVFAWYSAKKAPRLFKASLHKYQTANIHRIINLNAGLRTAELTKTTNTITVIKLRLKRGLTALEALQGINLSIEHRNNVERFIRRLKRANERVL